MKIKEMFGNREKKLNAFAKCSCFFLAISSIIFIFNFFKLDIATNATCFMIILITVFVNIEGVLLAIKKKTVVVSIVLTLIMTIVIGIAGHYMRVSSDAIENIAGVSTSVDTMGLYVLESSEIVSPEELNNATIGILKSLGRDVTDEGIIELDKVIKNNHKYAPYEDIATLSEALFSEEADAIFVNTAYYSLLNEIREETDSNMRCIYEIDVVRALDLDSGGENIDVTKEPFAVYISGNDNDGKLRANGRSDVNIVMIVNPREKKILLVNTPRDYYVSLAGIEKDDKLTHAGMYGVDTSVKTLEKLYDTQIPFYIRLNFTGFMDLIDSLGGITVNSDVDFTVAEWHFKKGKNELSGIESLAFARERYSFIDGDRQRGKNQQAVIKGIIEKLSSPKVITNYAQIIKSTSKALESNMPQDSVTALLNYQLSDNRKWDVKSISVDGKGKYGECYSFPSEELYIMIPDKETVNNAKETINQYMSVQTTTTCLC